MERETSSYLVFIGFVLFLLCNVFQNPLSHLSFLGNHQQEEKSIAEETESYGHVPHYRPPFILSVIPNTSCDSGHVDGMKPVCGGDGCLRVITNVKGQPKNVSIDSGQMQMIHKMDGYVVSTPLQADFVTKITAMQWHFGIYGSVGEIGVFHGKFTSVLACNTDTVRGERLFVADPYGFMKQTRPNMLHHHFFRNMKKLNFSPWADDEGHRLRVWFGSSLFLSKTVFVRWNIPAFRLVSIDGDHSRPLVLSDYRVISCVAREGGILVFDDVGYRWEAQVDQGIMDFFTNFGYSAFKPLVIVTNKLYVCTAKHYDRYMNYIRQHLAHRFGLKKVTRFLYSQTEKHTFYTNVPY